MLGKSEGHKVCHHYVSNPCIVSNRSFILTHYMEDANENEFTFACSSLNNQDLELKYQNRCFNDEIGYMQILIHCIGDIKSGTRVRMNFFVDPKGNIPKIFVQKIQATQASLISKISDYCQKNILPWFNWFY